MLTYWYNKQLKALYNELVQTGKAEIVHIKTGKSAPEKQVDSLKSIVQDAANLVFHREMDGYELQWKLKNKEADRFGGSIKIQSLEDMLGSWENIVYFNYDSADSPKREFKIVDFFTDEACVGFFTNKQPDLFYHEFESEFYPIHLSFEGYFTMLLTSYGIWYWPKVIVEINKKLVGPVTKHFIVCMTELFPDFNFENYKQEYQRYKLK